MSESSQSFEAITQRWKVPGLYVVNAVRAPMLWTKTEDHLAYSGCAKIVWDKNRKNVVTFIELRACEYDSVTVRMIVKDKLVYLPNFDHYGYLFTPL